MSGYIGVRQRGYTVEVKKWNGVGFCKDFKTANEGALVHDLVLMYSISEVDAERLNIQRLGFRIQEEDPALASFGEPLEIGKEFLIDFVNSNPLDRVGANPREQANSMKKKIVELAPRAFKGLKDWIAREHSALAAGRQRKDLDQIHTYVPGDGLLESTEEIQDLKATISAQDAALKAKDVALDAALKAKDAALETMVAALEAKDAALETMAAALETMVAALEAKDVALEAMDAALVAKDAALETMDAMLKLKDAAITSVQELYAVDKRAAIVTPFKPGLAEREEFHQNESNPASETWMEYMNWTTFNSHLPTD